jgi:ABC-type transport system involved in multi-copper enzyme maturation permease subunit
MLSNLRRLFNYNARILMGNSYWLLIVPVVASQLIIFWHMAIATLVNASTIANSFELVIPLLAAFLCAHVVAPEHQNRVDELTFVRPVPFLRTIALRMLSLYVVVAVLAAMMFIAYKYGLKKPFHPGITILAGLPSILFLSVLSLAFASAWRSAAVGIGAALAYWAADAAWGASLNPLFTLHGYSAALAQAGVGSTETSPDWMLSKAVLLVLTLVVGWVARAGLGRPKSPRQLRAVLRIVAWTLPLIVVYLVTGASWQLSKAREAAEQHPTQARIIYQQAFAGFGPIPTPYLFGSVFADYIDYPHQGLLGAPTTGSQREAAVDRLLQVAERHPESPWADHALYEAIRMGSNDAPPPGADDTPNRTMVQFCRVFLERYPASPFAPAVAARTVQLAALVGDEPVMMWAYNRALTAYRGAEGTSEAAEVMRAHYMSIGDVGRAIEAAQASADVATVQAKPEALLRLGAFLEKQGRIAEAREAYLQVDAAVKAKLAGPEFAIHDPTNVDMSVIAQRSQANKLRDQARQALAALNNPPASANATPPSPAPPPPAH